MAEAAESFKKWVQDKDAERKRIIEEKRLEQEEHQVKIIFFFKLFLYFLLDSRSQM
jgi:hypothetical protein